MVYRENSFCGNKHRTWVVISTVLFFFGWFSGVGENYIDASCIVGLVSKRPAGELDMGGKDREE